MRRLFLPLLALLVLGLFAACAGGDSAPGEATPPEATAAPEGPTAAPGEQLPRVYFISTDW